MSAQQPGSPSDPEGDRRAKPAEEGGEAPGEAPPPPPDRSAGMGYTFKFARLDGKSAFDFEDVADK
jgi:hypothetical protein